MDKSKPFVMTQDKPIIISLGGSLVVPNGGIDNHFLGEFNTFIRKHIARRRRFFIVIGGGATARHYIDGARNVVGTITDWDLDWLGIHATRINAHLVRTIFYDVAHPRIIANYEKKIENLKQPLVIAAGWKPGRSTDYCAVTLARDYQAKVIINMSNISAVCDKDPKKYTDAKPIHKITWSGFEQIVGTKWTPGNNAPFDPIATRLSKKLGLSVYVVGSDLSNVERILSAKEFTGTIISPS